MSNILGFEKSKNDIRLPKLTVTWKEETSEAQNEAKIVFGSAVFTRMASVEARPQNICLFA